MVRWSDSRSGGFQPPTFVPFAIFCSMDWGGGKDEIEKFENRKTGARKPSKGGQAR
jgi:hypothetical protein